LRDGACVTPGFTIVGKQSKSVRRISHPQEHAPPILDQVDLVLQGAQDLPVGAHKSEWVFKWAGQVPDTVVPVTVTVKPPVSPKIGAVFCGELAPGQAWKSNVPLVRRPDTRIRVKAIRCSQAFLKAQLAADNPDRLEISLSAPTTPGRFEGAVEILFDDARLQPVRLPVSGIVVQK
jgi:hypothetical protein